MEPDFSLYGAHTYLMSLGTCVEQPQSLNLSLYRVLSCRVSFPHCRSPHLPVWAFKSLRLGGGNTQFTHTCRSRVSWYHYFRISYLIVRAWSRVQLGDGGWESLPLESLPLESLPLQSSFAQFESEIAPCPHPGSGFEPLFPAGSIVWGSLRGLAGRSGSRLIRDLSQSKKMSPRFRNGFRF